MGKEVKAKRSSIENSVEIRQMKFSEMNKLVKRLPDWAYTERRKMAKRYRGYRYAVDGNRVDGIAQMYKTDGKYQWCLFYLFYRKCYKGKRTQYCSELAAAACIDKTGEYGIWISERIDKMKVAAVREKREFHTEVEEEDIMEAFKYCNIKAWPLRCYTMYEFGGFLIFSRSDMERYCAIFILEVALYLIYPQTEFIYRMRNRRLSEWMRGKLIDLMTEDKPETDFIKELIAVFRLGLKHGNQILEHEYEHYWGDWYDYIKMLWLQKKVIRNPHYFNITLQQLNREHNRVLERDAETEVKKQAANEYGEFMRMKKRFIGLRMVDKDGLEIMTLNSPLEYIEESRKMHNCIARLKYYMKRNSLILVARKNGKRIADIEFSLLSWSIIQCCGPCNRRVPESTQIQELIKKNLQEIERRHKQA